MAIVLWSVAFAPGESLVLAIPAGLVAAWLSTAAITGKCPHKLFRRKPEPKPNALGIPVARDALKL